MNKRILYRLLLLIMLFLSCIDSSGNDDSTIYKNNTVFLSIDNSTPVELIYGPANEFSFYVTPIIDLDNYLAAYLEIPSCSPYNLASPDNSLRIHFDSRPAAGSVFVTTSSEKLLYSLTMDGTYYKEDKIKITISNLDNVNNQLQGTLVGDVRDMLGLPHTIYITFSVYMADIFISDFEINCY